MINKKKSKPPAIKAKLEGVLCFSRFIIVKYSFMETSKTMPQKVPKLMFPKIKLTTTNATYTAPARLRVSKLFRFKFAE